MPTYTPVTRGAELPNPVPPQPTYNPYAAQPSVAPSQPSPQSHQPAPQAAPPPSYLQPNPAPAYQPADLQPHAYAAPPPPSHPASGYQGLQDGLDQAFQSRPQPYPGASAPHTSYADRAFPDPNAPAPDASFPEPSFAPEPAYADPGYAPQNFADASFPEPNFDASFPEAAFAGAPPAYDPAYAAQPGFAPYAEQGAPDYGRASHDQIPQSDPRRQLQAFDAIYDQPPQIALGATEMPPRRAPQDFYEERADADFIDESHVPATVAASSKLSKLAFIKGRSAFMVGSALLGAIALGGALAFAYKQSGGSMGEAPPVVQADNRPVKELPADAGGKEFPHKNKLIYDRLTNEDEPQSENLLSRQEDVAVPALPPSTMTGGLPNPVATTDMIAPQTTQAVDAQLADEAGPDGGPRRVKTMVVRPDGSVMPPEPEAMPVAAADAAGPEAAPAGAAPAAVPEAPAAATAPQQVAAQAAPAAAAAAAAPAQAAKYVVQLGAQKSQTEALASFADIQQKNPALLANYRPMVSKADLGAKGTLYRLRIGPVDGKTAADKLCGQLKEQGTDCFVVAQ
ncbi:MAG: SPOR domain-containing protein [Methyloceanibacter sp.]